MSHNPKAPPSMWLFTTEQRVTMIEQWCMAQEDEGGDPFPTVKLFLPGTGAVWLLTELQPDEQICFGLCDLGVGCPELGYVSLAEITATEIFPGVTVQQDKHFVATKPLSDYAREANEKGEIIA